MKIRNGKVLKTDFMTLALCSAFLLGIILNHDTKFLLYLFGKLSSFCCGCHLEWDGVQKHISCKCPPGVYVLRVSSKPGCYIHEILTLHAHVIAHVVLFCWTNLSVCVLFSSQLDSCLGWWHLRPRGNLKLFVTTREECAAAAALRGPSFHTSSRRDRGQVSRKPHVYPSHKLKLPWCNI